jgi:hypothetical protein
LFISRLLPVVPLTEEAMVTIRFLQALAPYSAGQTITVEQPSPWMLGLLDGVRAEVVRDMSEPEMAVARAPKKRKVWGAPS